MASQTPLYAWHQQAGAKIVDFGGWDMPLHYGSQVDEHHHVRKGCGIFDASHMTIVDIEGKGAPGLLRVLVANDVAKLKEAGQALYTCMLNHEGGIIDDLIVYYRGPDSFRLVVNASTRDKDIAWLERCATDFDVEIIEQVGYALIAVQGPASKQVFKDVSKHHNLSSLYDKVENLKAFEACEHNQVFVARTGYTGEFGYEIMMPEGYAIDTWKAFVSQGAVPCGLGCRDTLRIEAGLNLYGTDMDESTSPLESGLAWTVSFKDPKRAFNGREALEKQQAQGGLKQLKGIALAGKGVIRGHYNVRAADGALGITTSGTFSPTMSRSIGFMRISQTDQTDCVVEIRGREHKAYLCALPFVRNGTIRVDL